MARRILVVHNPVAGRGRAAKVFPLVAKMLHDHGMSFTSAITSPNQNATEVVKGYLDNTYTDVVVVGGDGTLNEVVNGMLGFALPLGIIPAGTGNDYVKMLNLGSSLQEQMDTALHGPVHAVDLGKCNSRLFVNGMGIGFDGQIAKNMTESTTWLTGHAKYYYHVLKILSSFDSVNLSLTLDGAPQKKDYLLLTIAKGTTFGGGFKLTPEAHLADGQFAICHVAPISPLRRFLNIRKLEKGTHHQLPEVSFTKAGHIHIGASSEALAHLDGEFIGSPPFDISVLPKALLVRTQNI